MVVARRSSSQDCIWMDWHESSCILMDLDVFGACQTRQKGTKATPHKGITEGARRRRPKAASLYRLPRPQVVFPGSGGTISDDCPKNRRVRRLPTKPDPNLRIFRSIDDMMPGFEACQKIRNEKSSPGMLDLDAYWAKSVTKPE